MSAARVIEDNNSKEDSVFFFLTTVSATENRGENEFLPRSPTVVERHARRRFSAATRRADAADGWFRVGIDGRDPARATAASYLAQEVILHMRARARARAGAGGVFYALWWFRSGSLAFPSPHMSQTSLHTRVRCGSREIVRAPRAPPLPSLPRPTGGGLLAASTLIPGRAREKR